MTTKYVDGTGLAYFYTTYCLTEAQVNALITTQLNTYKQDIVTVASTLPASGTEGILYLIPNATDGTKFDTYVWEITDDTTNPVTYGWKAQSEAHLSVDLSNYYTKSETDSTISAAIVTSIASGAIKTALDAKLNASDLVPLTNAEIDALMV